MIIIIMIIMHYHGTIPPACQQPDYCPLGGENKSIYRGETRLLFPLGMVRPGRVEQGERDNDQVVVW